jgi:hypothetical protein
MYNKNVHFMYQYIEKHQQVLTNPTQHVWCQKYTHMNHISQLRYDEVSFQMTVDMKWKIQNILKYKIKNYVSICQLVLKKDSH